MEEKERIGNVRERAAIAAHRFVVRHIHLIATAASTVVTIGALIGALVTAAYIPSSPNEPVTFTITPGAGITEIAHTIRAANIIRSELLFTAYAVLVGDARALKPGTYTMAKNSSLADIVRRLAHGPRDEIEVVIPEGATIVQIDKIISSAGVFPAGSLAAYATHKNLEGYLFPDTYRFFASTTPADVAEKMEVSFKTKARPLLTKDPVNEKRNLILASIVEKEVTSESDRRIVAGILLKRLAVSMALQVDSSICYIKEQRTNVECYPLERGDFEVDSPYNTYVRQGLPPAPISNPGISAIEAVLDPAPSPYWYYLSDPTTKETVFSTTLDEQNQNRVKYLSR